MAKKESQNLLKRVLKKFNSLLFFGPQPTKAMLDNKTNEIATARNFFMDYHPLLFFKDLNMPMKYLEYILIL